MGLCRGGTKNERKTPYRSQGTTKGWLQKSRQEHHLCCIVIIADTSINTITSRSVLRNAHLIGRLRARRSSCSALFGAGRLTIGKPFEIYMCHNFCNQPLHLCPLPSLPLPFLLRPAMLRFNYSHETIGIFL